MNNPLVSIVTPTYNRAHTIHRVFNSLANQTFQNFEWIIINDGSTDNTDEIVDRFIEKAEFPIIYRKQENQHKFITVLNGCELASGKYFTSMDSDDSFPNDSLQTLVEEFEKVNTDDNIVYLCGIAQYPSGEIVGDYFPHSPFDCTVFEQRYKYKITGDKFGIGLLSNFKKIISDKDLFIGKGFIPEDIINLRYDSLGKHRFINKVVIHPHRDLEDNISLSNSFYNDENAFGLTEVFKLFINSYSKKFFNYPMVIFRNLGGYLIFARKDNRRFAQIIKEIQPFWLKIVGILVYPVLSLISNKVIPK